MNDMSASWKDFVKCAYAVSKDGKTVTFSKGENPSTVSKGLGIKVDDLLKANPGVEPERYIAGKAYMMPVKSPVDAYGNFRKAVDLAAPFIEKHEGFRGNAYWDVIGNKWTVGHGHTEIKDPKTGKVRPVVKGDVMTAKDSSDLLKSRLRQDASKMYGKMKWSRGLKPGYIAALLDIAYIAGLGILSPGKSPSFTKKVTAPGADVEAIVRSELPTYRKSNGKVVPAIERRRKEAIKQLIQNGGKTVTFSKGDSPSVVAKGLGKG